MKAAVVEQPGRLVVREVPDPQIGPYDALCRMLYGAVCTGTDQHLIAGRFPWPIEYPSVLGHESIGRVVEVGSSVRNFKPGDLVTRVGNRAAADGSLGVCWGGFAELGVATDHWAMQADGLPKEQWDSARVNQILPGEFDPAAATMVITWRETLSYLTRMGVEGGASVLVIGSGGNALAFTAHSANAGAARVVVLGSRLRESAARAAGATAYLDYKAADVPAALAGAAGGGFDFIIDAVGKTGAVDAVLAHLKPGGMVGIYGIDDYGDLEVDQSLAPGPVRVNQADYDEPETHDRVVALIREGKLQARTWIDLDHPYPLAEINAAYQAARTRAAIKPLIKLSE